MKAWKIVIAFFFTLLLLFFTRKTTAVRSIYKMVEHDGVRIEHNTVPKQVGDNIPVIKAKVRGASEVNLVYKIGKEGQYKYIKMNPISGEENSYEADIPLHPKGSKAWYYLEASKEFAEGEMKITLPERNSGEVQPIRLKFEGKVPAYVVIPHVFSIFAAFFFATLTLFSAIDLKRRKITLEKSVRFCAVTLLLLFIGFFPFGWAMNYFAFGVLWEAFPFGTDVTDNKSQIMFAFWLVTMFLVKGTLFGKGAQRNLVSDRRYSTMVIVSFIATILIIMAIPHSL
jgi:hypothetical protein